eukprot:GHVU01198764.1.p1 GENE.GHVU01198764.1~~GHVU01198764.1.p1  ORF type:complete len:441 (+),score=130.43 GHVU01198764.1:190-1323(+)
MASALLKCGARTDADENNLRVAALEALSMVISKLGRSLPESVDVTTQIVDQLAQGLQVALLQMGLTDASLQLQALLCGCLSSATYRLAGTSEAALPQHVASRLYELYTQGLEAAQRATLIKLDGAPAADEAMMAITALVATMGEQFAPFVKSFLPHLQMGLKNYEDVSLCKTCVDAAGMLCTKLRTDMQPLAAGLLQELHEILTNPLVDQAIKPVVMTTVGDIAMAIGVDFHQFFDVFKPLLVQAANAQYSDGPLYNDDWVAYIISLREGVLAAYTGMLHGYRDTTAAASLAPELGEVLRLVEQIVRDFNEQQLGKENMESALDLVGDIIDMYGQTSPGLQQQQFFVDLVASARKSGEEQLVQKAQRIVNVSRKAAQ